MGVCGRLERRCRPRCRRQNLRADFGEAGTLIRVDIEWRLDTYLSKIGDAYLSEIRNVENVYLGSADLSNVQNVYLGGTKLPYVRHVDLEQRLDPRRYTKNYIRFRQGALIGLWRRILAIPRRRDRGPGRAEHLLRVNERLRFREKLLLRWNDRC